MDQLREQLQQLKVSSQELRTPRKSSILIVDDLALNILMLKVALGKEKYVIDTAKTGMEAIKMAFNKNYDLILLDLRMPDMDGFEVAEILQSNPINRSFPIIFLAPFVHKKGAMMKGFEVGAVDFISRPIDLNILKLKVRNYLRNFIH